MSNIKNFSLYKGEFVLQKGYYLYRDKRKEN